jgi:hypothetical protein
MSDEQIVVSFDGVKMKEFRAYWMAVARGNWVEQDKFFARVVKSWPFTLNPSNFESYGELEFHQYISVQTAIKLASKTVVSQVTDTGV